MGIFMGNVVISWENRKMYAIIFLSGLYSYGYLWKERKGTGYTEHEKN